MITFLLLLGLSVFITYQIFDAVDYGLISIICIVLAVILLVGAVFLIAITPSVYIPTAKEYAATVSLYNECLETRDSEAIAAYNAQAAIINEGRENFYSWRWTRLSYMLFDKFAEYPQLLIIIEGAY